MQLASNSQTPSQELTIYLGLSLSWITQEGFPCFISSYTDFVYTYLSSGDVCNQSLQSYSRLNTNINHIALESTQSFVNLSGGF